MLDATDLDGVVNRETFSLEHGAFLYFDASSCVIVRDFIRFVVIFRDFSFLQDDDDGSPVF